MQRIGLDGIILRGRDAGSLRYFQQLLDGLAVSSSNDQYIVFADAQVCFSDTLASKDNFVFHPIASPRFFSSALRQQCFQAWDKLGRLDLLHCPLFVPPLFYNRQTVMTVLDLTFELYPQTKSRTGLFWWKLLGCRGIGRANRIITLATSTKSDLRHNFGIAEERVQVVYPYARSIFRPDTRRAQVAATYKLPAAYILYLGTLEPRKNIPNLLRAFALAKQRGALPHVLVLAGQPGWRYRDVFQTVERLGIKEHVIFLGYVPDEDLPGLYSGADLFAYLSWYEGFGFPVLEAMACGTPVLTSNVSALPEVVGDAGILVPPNDPEQAADAIVRVLADAEWRRELSARGLARAALFTQERFARGILQVYEEVLQS